MMLLGVLLLEEGEVLLRVEPSGRSLSAEGRLRLLVLVEALRLILA